MGDRIQRVVDGIRHMLQEHAVSVTDERLIRYIVEELRKCRSFDEVMADPYVMNRTDEAARARLLESPAILRGIEQEICAHFEDYEPTSASGI